MVGAVVTYVTFSSYFCNPILSLPFAVCVLKDITEVYIVNAYRYKDISFETSNNFRQDLKPI